MVRFQLACNLTRHFFGPAVAMLLAGTLSAQATTQGSAEEDAKPVVFEDAFEEGLNRWEILDEGSWEIGDFGRGKSLSITRRESSYQPRFRSPLHIALIKNIAEADFILEFEVKSTKDTGNHRDCCVFFGYQNPSQYYYVHLGARPDPASGQIMIVDNAARRPLTNNQSPVPWDNDWHRVRLERSSKSGDIKIYFDDFSRPLMQVKDTTFGEGRIGLGSFDDMDAFDSVTIRKIDSK